MSTSNTFTDITASQISVTSKLANSSFFYQATLSVESDVASAYQNFIRMAYTVNGGSTVLHDDTKVFNGNSIKDENGALNTGITYLFDGITHSAGTVLIVFFIQYSKVIHQAFILINNLCLDNQVAHQTWHLLSFRR